MSGQAAADIGEPMKRFESLLEETGDVMAQDGPDYQGPATTPPPVEAEEEDTAPEEASGEDGDEIEADTEEVDEEIEATEESDETDSDQEEAEEIEPEEVIDPPSSWSAADKLTFQDLPIEAQRAIAQREAQRERFVNEKAREIAEQRKALEAEREAIAQDRQGKMGQLDAALSAMAAEIQGEFSDVNWETLAATDPAEYVALKAKYESRVQKFNQAKQARDEQARQAQGEQQERLAQFIKAEQEALFEKLPEWSDPDRAKTEKAELLQAGKSYGFTDDELSQLIDHRTVLVLRDAAKYRALQKSKAKVAKKVADKPKVQKPGHKNVSSGDSRDRRLAEKRKQLRKTGKAADAASVFEEFL